MTAAPTTAISPRSTVECEAYSSGPSSVLGHNTAPAPRSPISDPCPVESSRYSTGVLSSAAKRLLHQLPGADLVRQGLQDHHAGCDTAESCLVEIARPRLERAGLLEPAPHRLDAEIRLYHHLGSRSTNPHGLFNSLLRELVSFEHALDHRLARENSKCTMGDAK